MRSKNGSNLKHLRLSKNEKRWQTKQEKRIKAYNGARSHALNHSSGRIEREKVNIGSALRCHRHF